MPSALVIEDDESFARLLCSALEGRGVTTRCVSSAELAIVELAHNRFDYALVDVILPGGSGLYVVEAVRRLEPPERPTVILMTAGSVPSATDRSIVKGVLLKPLDVNAVAAFVSTMRPTAG